MCGAQLATKNLCNYNCPLFLLQFNLGAKPSYARPASLALNPTTLVQSMISLTALVKPDVALAHQVSRRTHAPQPINKAEKDAILMEFHNRHPLETVNKYKGEPIQVDWLQDADAAVGWSRRKGQYGIRRHQHCTGRVV